MIINKIYFAGLDQKFDGYFKGYLAGLTLLKDNKESDNVIKCFNNFTVKSV